MVNSVDNIALTGLSVRVISRVEDDVITESFYIDSADIPSTVLLYRHLNIQDPATNKFKIHTPIEILHAESHA